MYHYYIQNVTILVFIRILKLNTDNNINPNNDFMQND